MTERARRAFQAYVELGPERTLAKVSKLASLPLVTLKRWSTRFSWQTIIRQQEQIAAQAICRRIAAHAAADLQWPNEQGADAVDLAVRCGILSSLRESFAKRLALPIDDPNAIKLTPAQFFKVCEEELALRERLDQLLHVKGGID